IDRVGRAPIPRLAGRSHLGGDRDDEVALEEAAELPAVGEMLEQRLALELGQDVDRVDAGVDEVAQDEVDDAVLASERDRGLCPLLGEREEPGSLAAGEYDSEDAEPHGGR